VSHRVFFAAAVAPRRSGGRRWCWYRLRSDQGRVARAKLLVAAAHLGLAEPTMVSGETIEAWLGRGLRAHLRHEDIVPLLRAAARAAARAKVTPGDIELRAP
jgi:hypothetical protein